MNSSRKLNSTWAIYYASRKEKDHHISYEQRLKKVIEFSTLEDFLNSYLNIKPINEINHSCDISFFKKGYKPLWESCQDGGLWLYRFKRTDDMKEINNQWEKVLLALITEKFNEIHILGATISLRTRETIIELWFNYFKKDSIKNSVLKTFKEILNANNNEAIFYFQEIRQSLNAGSTLKNAEAFFLPKSRKLTYNSTNV